MSENEHIHPGVRELSSEYQKGKISRREFIRYSALLGMSAVAAGRMVYAGGQQQPSVSPGTAGIRRGGIVKTACAVLKVGHPAQRFANDVDHPALSASAARSLRRVIRSTRSPPGDTYETRP